MAGRVITVTSGKGGVGKTTSTANIGAGLALLGKKVAILDADFGLRNLDIVMGLENRIEHDVVDYVECRCPLEQALVRDRRAPELYLLPASQDRDHTVVAAAQMMQVGDALRTGFDYIVIDSPSGIGPGVMNAIAPADEVLVVANPEVPSVRNAGRVIGLVRSQRKVPVRLVINRLVAQRVKRHEALSPQDISDALSIEIIGLVPEDEAIQSSSNRGAPVVFSGRGPAADAFRDIARRISGEDVPVVMPQTTQWWQRLLGRAA
jgi:septum site-determining protein MinD